jgi:geranylgeranyl diphosphate synthase type I
MNPTHHAQVPTREALREAIEEELKQCLRFLDDEKEGMMATMIAYHMGWEDPSPDAGGKRVRSLLTLFSCGAAGGDWKDALPAAGSIELIHNFSLIHDDIQDRSRKRRGRPTLWSRWGVPQAINTGDAVFVLAHIAAYRLLERGIPADTTLQIIKLLDQTCLTLTVGQHLDLAYETQKKTSQEAYLQMIERKTSALLAAATAVGGMVAGADPKMVEKLRLFGHHLGLAYQIQDDILGIWGEPEITGKPVADDLRSRKKSFLVLHGLAHSEPFQKLWEARADDVESLDAMRETLERAGSLSAAREQAREHTRIALDSLQEIEPDNSFLAELRLLGQQLIDRDR